MSYPSVSRKHIFCYPAVSGPQTILLFPTYLFPDQMVICVMAKSSRCHIYTRMCHSFPLHLLPYFVAFGLDSLLGDES